MKFYFIIILLLFYYFLSAWNNFGQVIEKRLIDASSKHEENLASEEAKLKFDEPFLSALPSISKSQISSNVIGEVSPSRHSTAGAIVKNSNNERNLSSPSRISLSPTRKSTAMSVSFDTDQSLVLGGHELEENSVGSVALSATQKRSTLKDSIPGPLIRRALTATVQKGVREEIIRQKNGEAMSLKTIESLKETYSKSVSTIKV